MEFPDLSDDDVKYISKLKYSDFGRLSRKLLVGIRGCNKDTGEVDSIMGMLWSTNDNMMKLLSNSYTFIEEIEAIKMNTMLSIQQILIACLMKCM